MFAAYFADTYVLLKYGAGAHQWNYRLRDLSSFLYVCYQLHVLHVSKIELI